jgi:hypothetical protein
MRLLKCGDEDNALVRIKVIERVFSQDQKQQMIERLTEGILVVEGEKHAIHDVATDRRQRQKRRLGNWRPSRQRRRGGDMQAPQAAAAR